MRATAVVLLVTSVLAFASPAVTATPDCQRLEAARERAWQQLRRGHGVAQGNRLRARVRQLNEQIAQHCQ